MISFNFALNLIQYDTPNRSKLSCQVSFWTFISSFLSLCQIFVSFIFFCNGFGFPHHFTCSWLTQNPLRLHRKGSAYILCVHFFGGVFSFFALFRWKKESKSCKVNTTSTTSFNQFISIDFSTVKINSRSLCANGVNKLMCTHSITTVT